jgi:hypothetical protein
MAEASKSYVVECFLPGVDDADVERSAASASAEVDQLAETAGLAPGDIEYLGALFMAVDEVVLHVFRAVDPELVRQVSQAAGLPFERIVESVEVLPGALARPSGDPSAPGASAPATSVPSLLQPREVLL